MASDQYRSFVDLDISRVTDSARMKSNLAKNASNSSQHHSNKPSGAAAVPTAAMADPYGPPPLSVKLGTPTRRSRGCRCSPLAWAIMAVVIILVTGAALGIGLGLGLRSSTSSSGSDEGMAGPTMMTVTPQPAQQQPATQAPVPQNVAVALPAAPPVIIATSALVAPIVDTPTSANLLPEDKEALICTDACVNCALNVQPDDCPRCTRCNSSLGR
jgi:hypothetical protein